MKYVLRLLVLGAILATPSLGATQQADQSEAVPSAEPDVEAWLTEYEGIHRQLQGIQQKALEDPDLTAAQIALGDQIRTAMEAEDPTIADHLKRAETLEVELQTAQQTGNAQRLEELLAEAQSIEEHFFTVQQVVVAKADIATAIGAFQTRLEQKMTEVDPTAPTLIARFKELELKLEQAMRAGA